MWRTLMGILTVVLALGVNAYFLYEEPIAPSEERYKHIAKVQDPLIDISYVRGNREPNFRKFGLDDAQIKRALKLTNDLEDAHAEKIRQFLLGAPKPVELADALCGGTEDVRPRFGALRFLVEEKNGIRNPIDLNRVSGFASQDWALTSTIPAVYREVELQDARPDNATLMALAAIMAKKESDVLDHKAPWGRGLMSGTWSWDRVKSENPGIEERLLGYIGLMHLVVEMARAEGGNCRF